MLTREQVLGCRATIRTEPSTSRRWRESIFVAALDSIDFLESRIASLEAERDRAVELLKEPCVCAEGNNEHRDSMGAWICKPCHDKESFLASIGGEGK